MRGKSLIGIIDKLDVEREREREVNKAFPDELFAPISPVKAALASHCTDVQMKSEL